VTRDFQGHSEDGKYSKLSVPDRWKWHADVYAFRRVFLGVSRDERTSPCDTDGKWFHEQMVDDAERKLRINLTANIQARKEAQTKANAIRARELLTKWVKQQGYDDIDTYCFVERVDYTEMCVRYVRSLPGPRAVWDLPSGKVKDPHELARSLGVKAREYTKEELRAGRIALGLEQPDNEPDAAE
jgi:hypothetical protein